jgi:hypothetical protein
MVPACSYNADMRISGIVYMNDISQKRMYGSTRMNLKMFTKLCGEDSFTKVVLATSRWDTLPSSAVGEQRLRELASDFWKPLLDNGVSVMPIRNKPEDQAAIVYHLIEVHITSEHQKRRQRESLQIQEEIVDLQKSIPATEAGKELKYTLKELLRLQKESEANSLDEMRMQQLQEKKALVKKQIKDLRLSLGERIKGWFGA